MSASPTIQMDIVIPSFRADFKVLESIRNLDCPSMLDRRIIIVLDDPNHTIPEQLEAWKELPDITIIRNRRNLGANRSRNRGIEEASAEWILFLDDDIVPEPNLLQIYAEAIWEDGDDVPGFVGTTRFPSPVNSFTRGIVASDILTFFDLAENREEMSWGITANILIKRIAIAEHRFRSRFPKEGGGEDIDLCLEIVNSYGTNFATEPKAIVHHPWWNGGKRSYRRFSRWAYGDSQLPELHPQYRWRNYPNTAESLIALILFSIPFIIITDASIWELVLVGIGLFFGDWVTEWIRLSTVKSIFSPLTAIESSLVRFSNDIGRLRAVFESFRPWRITERFDYVTTGEWIKAERRWNLLRVGIQVGLIFLILLPLSSPE